MLVPMSLLVGIKTLSKASEPLSRSKARLYLGPDYDVSHKKAEALKQGKLSQLDKLNTAAKVRCARDMGIGTEYALEFNENDEMPPAGQASQAEALATIKAEVKTLGLARNPA